MLDATAGVEVARLRAVHELGLLDTAFDERYDRITRLAAKLLNAPMAAISLIDEDRQWFKSTVGTTLRESHRRHSFCSVAIGAGPDLFEVPDLASDPRFRDNPVVAGPSHVRFYAGLPLAVSRDHLVGTLCVLDVKPRHLSEAEREALKDLATWVEKEMTVNDELERAAALQVGLLGAPEPELAGYKIAARCIPTGAVGGDFFDWYEPRRGAIAFSLGDVMGKGMPAAIMMATVRASLRAAARQASFASSVRFAAQAIHSDLARSDAFVTIFAGYLDGRSGGLRYVDAGHGLAMVRHADGTVELPTMRGLPFGIDPVERYTEGMLTLSPGDLLLVYSDGMMEALREPEPEDIARLAGADAGQAIRRLTAKAGTWSDDITLIAVSRDPEK